MMYRSSVEVPAKGVAVQYFTPTHKALAGTKDVRGFGANVRKVWSTFGYVY